MPKARKVIIVLLVIFALYAILNSPQQSADVVRSAFERLLDGLGAIGEFFNRLITSDAE